MIRRRVIDLTGTGLHRRLRSAATELTLEKRKRHERSDTDGRSRSRP